MTNKTKNIKKALEAIIDIAYPIVTPYRYDRINVNSLVGVRSLTEDYFIDVGRICGNRVHITFYSKDSEDSEEKPNRIVDVFESYNDSKTMACFEIVRYLLKNKLI